MPTTPSPFTQEPTLNTLITPPAGEIGRARANLAVLELLAELGPDARGDHLTDTDRTVLAAWSGWGPMAKAFAHRPAAPWDAIAADVERLLLSNAEAYSQAKAATPTSYYTDETVIDAVWDLASELGFDGGDVLEPGCAHGRFIAGGSRLSFARPVAYTGIEADTTSARIAELLHPDATIKHTRLEDCALRPGSFDLAVGNVPFADVHIYDRARAKEWGRPALHNYFLARALDALRPGGYLIAVTSRFTLDAQDYSARKVFAGMADLVGAIRLPEGAFRAFGTDVVADLVVFHRTTEPSIMPGWLNSRDDPDRIRAGRHVASPLPYRVTYNDYFYDNPGMVLGKTTADSTMYGNDSLTVTPDLTEPLGRQLGQALNTIAREAPRFATSQAGGLDEPLWWVADDEGRKESSYHIVDGQIVRVECGRLVKVQKAARTELSRLIVLRNAVLDVLTCEAEDGTDEQLALLRFILNGLYDRYVAEFGPINRCHMVEGKPDPETQLPTQTRRRPPVMAKFRQDPDYVAVLAIEDYDDDTGVAKKGPIFTQRVNHKPDPVTSVATPAEAIAVCFDQLGHLDEALVAKLLGVDLDDVSSKLADVAFTDPVTGRWLSADEYLSGNVRVKLREARAAAATDLRFARNVEALHAVQPLDLAPDEIKVQLGTPWIPAEVVAQFILETLEPRWCKPGVNHEPETATWEITGVYKHEREQPIASATWGTSRVDAYRLVQLALNADAPVVYDQIDKSTKVRNVEQTMLAVEKMRALTLRFGEWVWQDPDRADRLAAIYNELFNSTVLRSFDGSALTFPGMVAGFTPYQSQVDFVQRAMCTPGVLCGHAVGGGKTSIMAMLAMKLRDLGFANKPCAIVPNHLLEQVAREIKALFPSRRILMISGDDTKKERRKLFAAKVATGEWDLVVMTHTAFTALPVGEDVEQAYLGEQIAAYERAMNSGKNDGAAITVKNLAKSLERLRQRHAELLDKRVDDGVTFSMLGIDYLLVDESQYFKNLGFPTRVQGLSMSASKRAEDLDMKMWMLRERSNGARWAALFTGTAVSNTLAEMYVIQHYLQPARLIELGIGSFDAWAGAFIEFETKIEVAPDGGSFRMHRRPSKFSNVAELRRIFGEVAEIRTKKDLGLPGPKVSTDNVVIPASPELKQYVASLVERADKVRTAGRPKPGGDNMLKVCTDGRKAALDLTLVGHLGTDLGKVREVVDKVAATYHANTDRAYLDLTGEQSPIKGSFQLVFCDLGTPNPDKGSQVYGLIRTGLAAAGVPLDKVRFIHEAKTDAQKSALFSECRSGKVAVLLGSTDKLGVGTNVQHRLVHIHHVDAPWRPSDVEQRDGRGDRPGNQNDELQVTRYVREGSFDAYMWQGLERKARFIAQVLTGDLTTREVADIGDNVLSYNEIKALATGNPLVMDHAEATAEVARLRQLRSGHNAAQDRTKRQIEGLTSRADRCDTAAALWTRLAGAADATAGWRTAWDQPMLDPEEQRADVIESIATSIEAVWLKARRNGGSATGRIGSFHGVELMTWVRCHYSNASVYIMADFGGGEHDTLRIVEANDELLAPSQRFRFLSKLEKAMRNAEANADELYLEAAGLRSDADAAAAQVMPFPQADDLAAAEAHAEAIEQEMNDVMEAQEASPHRLHAEAIANDPAT